MEPSSNRNPLRRIAIVALIAAPIGGALGYATGRALKRGHVDVLRDWSIADLASLVIALMLIISAGFVGWAATHARRWNEMVERLPADESLDPAALVNGRRQALVAGLAGVMLALPPLAAHAGLSMGGAALAALGVGLLLAVQTWINLRLWRDGDELTRAVIAQSGGACFWLLQLALFGWATLTRLKLLPEADAWTLVTVMMSVYLLVSFIVSARRGLVVT